MFDRWDLEAEAANCEERIRELEEELRELRAWRQQVYVRWCVVMGEPAELRSVFASCDRVQEA